jgi:hypothetical protein
LYPKDWWDRPDPAKRKIGDPQKSDLHLAVGEALSHWAEVEDELGHLLAYMCLNQETLFLDPYLPAIFGSIENISARLKAFLLTHYPQPICCDTKHEHKDWTRVL